MKTLVMIAAFASSAVLVLPTISQAQTEQFERQWAAYSGDARAAQIRA